MKRPREPETTRPARQLRPAGGEAAMPVRSVVVHRDGEISRVALHEDRVLNLGRGSDNDVVFDNDRVSRNHGALRFDEGWWYVDAGSANGSYVGTRADKQRIDDNQLMQAGFKLATAGEPIPVEVGHAIVLGSRGTWIELSGAQAPSVTPADEALRSAAAQQFDERLTLAARGELPVFLLGPSGAGKTHAAREIYTRGGSVGAFVLINCARLPSDTAQLQSELLGHVKGSFTGAGTDRIGKLRHADGGTLFLDEVESLPPAAQGFLLDVLEGSGDAAPLGAQPTKRPLPPPRFRLISASKLALKKSGLRADLCERLAQGYTWRVPTLDERKEDIPGLLRAFAAELQQGRGLRVRFDDDALAYAQEVAWPGQLRALRAMVDVVAQSVCARSSDAGRNSAAVLRRSDVEAYLRDRAEAFGEDTNPGIGSETALPTSTGSGLWQRPLHPRVLTVDDVRAALAAHAGNKTAAAKALGIARNTLAARLREFGLDEG